MIKHHKVSIEHAMANSATDERSLWKKHFGKILVGIFLIGIILSISPIIIYIIHYPGPISSSHNSWGVFGDFIGGTVGPILSFLALMALLLTLYLQREELKNSVKELGNSSRALEQSSASFKLQNFEHSFFSLANFLSQTSENFKYYTFNRKTNETTSISGFPAFGSLYGNFGSNYGRISNEGNNQETHSRITEEFQQINRTYINDLYHYFGVLESIFKLIEKSDISADKNFYVQILRSQLSVDHLNLLFYFSIWEKQSFGRSKLPEYISTYKFFEDYDVKLLIHPAEHYELLGLKIYGDNVNEYQQDIKNYIELMNNPEAGS